ncbi:Beta-mannanase [Frankia sp. Hr75.2]|nr:Beta-mannanase [Frankia sp. Hr75.2]
MEHRRGDAGDPGSSSGEGPPRDSSDDHAGDAQHAGDVQASGSPRAGGRRGPRSKWAAGPAGGQPGRRRRVLLLGGIGAAMAVVLLAVGIVVLTGGEDEPPTTHPTTGGVSWVSGANANPPNDLAGWEKWIGRPTDIAMVFTARTNWQTITQADWPMSDFRPGTYPGKLSVAQPLFPQSGSEAACARGDYDSHWRDFGTTMIRNERPDAIVRLGWEFNGDWFWWHPRDTVAWKTCFRRAVAAMRSTDPQVRIDWNMTAHRDTMPNGDNVWDAYPGDDVVDIISIDAYDSYPASATQKIFNNQCNRASGACSVAAAARERGKQFAVPEWGLVRSTGGGGDNPFYVEKMYELFVANRDILAYEGYYSASPAETENVGSSLHNPTANPESAKRYLELFGPRVSAAQAGAGTSTPAGAAPLTGDPGSS